MTDIASSIQGVFALAALIIGACSGRPKRAALWGAVIGMLPAVLMVAAVVSAGTQNLDTPRFAGYLIGMVGGCAVFALLGYGIKRLFRRKPRTAPDP